jgi:uncharacterized protein YcbK (DUF882 family)
MCDMTGRVDPTSAARGGSRRGTFLLGIGAALISAALPQAADATVHSDFPNARFLWVVSAGTGTKTNSPFTLDGKTLYEPGYFAICDVMRDFHVDRQAGDVEIDVRLIEGLYEIQQVLAMAGVDRPLTIHSGYRTPQTNGEVGGALRSYHMRAMAADFHVDGVALSYVWKVCKSRPIIGGVGYYPNDGHIHGDCGPSRYWEG